MRGKESPEMSYTADIIFKKPMEYFKGKNSATGALLGHVKGAVPIEM